MRILYVEDNPRHADLTVRTLHKSAPQVRLETVSTIGEAYARLDRIASDPLDLVLTDMHLHDGDGLSLLQHIRENSLPLAVVLITGMGDEETAVAALKARADDYVVKHKDYLQRLPIILESALNHYRADAARRARPLNILYAGGEFGEVESTRRHFAVHADHLHLNAVFTGLEVLSALKPQGGDRRYDVLLMNFDLHELNALEVLRELRLTHQQDVPVVLLCRAGDEELARQGLKLGASSYLVKSPGYLYQLPWELEEAHSRADLLRREAALRESDSRLRRAQQAARVGTWEWDISTGLSVWSEMLWQLLGLEPDDSPVTVERFIEFIHPEDRARALRKVNEVMAEGEEYTDEFRIVRRDGVVLWVSSKGRVIRSAAGQPERMIGVNIDITERKLAEDALKESENQIRLFVEHTPVAVAMFDREMRYLLTSRRWLEDNNLGEQDIIGRSHYEVVPDIPEHWREGHRRCLAGAVERYEEDILPHPDETFDWVRWEIRPWYGANGVIGGIIMFSEIITERKKAEQAISFQAHLLNTIEQAVIATDLDGVVIFWNQFAERLYGWAMSEVTGQNLIELLGCGDSPSQVEEIWSQLRNGQSWAGEFTLRRRDETTLQLWVNDSPIYDERGNVVGVLGISYDITERKRADAVIREHGQLLQGVFSSISAHVVVLDRLGLITYASRSWNQFAVENQGRAQSVSVGVNYLEVCRRAAQDGDEIIREVLQGISAVISREQPRFVFEYPCHAPNQRRWFLMHVDPLPAEHGGVVISHIDITDRKLASEALKSALAEVRQLKDRLQEENIYLQEEVRVASNFGEIIGESQALKRVLSQAEQVAPADTTVLILGETGTGKELLAHAIHKLSQRNKHTLVKVNCAALPAPLIESELFGHEKGAFTGATAQRRGRFELADGGTIFLDEVGELPLELQAKLLRVLEDGEFERVGGSRTLNVDVRVIAATNRNLAEAVRQGIFRSDLYYRLNIYPITMPPLREHREDIPLLVAHFVKQLNSKMGKEIETVPQSAVTALQNYHWPGNIRELRNVIERAVIITRGAKLQLIDNTEPLAQVAGFQQSAIPFVSQSFPAAGAETLEQSEYNLILRTLKQVYWKVEGPGGAAELLKINPSTLRARMKKLGIARP
jgi:formate hydrogenlyase transcriptional activator